MTDLSLREQIASTICGDRAVDNWNATDADYELANAILELLKGAVKPLEWCAHGDIYKSVSSVGEYQAHPTANTRNQKFAVYFVCVKRKSWTIGYVDGSEAAKAAAQADYSRRILAALGVK
jgi:hypothetical protein